MGLGIGLACCCGCPGFCSDIARATILITLKGIVGTRPIPTPDATCPDCDFFNQTYPLVYQPSGETLYSLQCPPYEDMVTNCVYAYYLQCDTSSLTIHFLPYTTAGGDRRGYVEVRFFGGDLWIQSADFLMASGATAIECLAFTLEDEPLEYCQFIGSDPASDCEPATAIDLSIEAG
jgi:hypothetical protein